MNDLRQWLLEATVWGVVTWTWVWSFKRFAQASGAMNGGGFFSKDTGRQWLLGFFLWGMVAWIWAWSFRLFAQASAAPITRLDKGSLFTALFGAASIALFILSLLVATLAILGWQSIKEYIEERAEKAITERSQKVEEAIRKTQELETELRGRAATILGHTMGEMSLEPGTFKVKDRDRLSEALVQCKKGHEFLKKIGDAPEFLALNNLVFYTCVFEEDSLKKSNEDWMLESARRLLDAGQKHGSNMLELTACRVLLAYGASQREKDRARSILKIIGHKRSAVSERERKEARFYLDHFEKPAMLAPPVTKKP